MKKFFIVAHSHLDREWYRTMQENRIRLTRFLDDLLETMGKNPDYTVYNLDAQTSFCDDYFDVKPENEERFRKLVQAGRFTIGPWYVQPDEHLPTAEGIIRNMLISKKISDKYGQFHKVAYVPDSFGQSSSFPTIVKGFGIDSAIFYRGFSEDDSKYNDFIWEGLDGSRIIANWMPVGYGNAMFLKENDDEKNMYEIEENLKLLSERSVSDNLLLMCGSDQSFVKKWLPNTVKRLNELYKDQDFEFIIASPQDYIEAIRPYQHEMEVVTGELRKGKRSRTHNSIGATRLDYKKLNFEVEHKYLKVLEPINVISGLFGFDEDSQLINRGWKYIVENSAHDSYCNCCTDIIHKELLMRLMYADQNANYLIDEKFNYLHQLVQYNEKEGRPILLFSSNASKRKQIIELEIFVKSEVFAIFDRYGNELTYEISSHEKFNLKDTKVSFTPIPDDYYSKMMIRLHCSTSSTGFETVYIKENVVPSKDKQTYIIQNGLSNGLIQVVVNDHGSLDITDLITKQVYLNQHVFIDDGNAGDEYDYSPSFCEYRVDSLNKLIQSEVVEDTMLQASYRLIYRMMVPITTSNEKRSDELTIVEIISIVTVKKGERQVYLKTSINNTAENHRIQVLFDAQVKLRTNIADIQLGEIVRENWFSQTKESENGWHERYYPVFNQHKYSGFKDSNLEGFVIMNKGLPQYEIYDEETTKLAVTILSSVGFMGNMNLKYRPGRRSGSTDATPDSQMKGVFNSEYCFVPISKDVDYIQIAENYINPIIGKSFAEYSSEGSLPDSLNIITCNDGLLISCFKTSEDRNGVILRVMNPYSIKKMNIVIQVNRFLFSKIEIVNLAETQITDLRVKISKLNNADGSGFETINGTIEISSMNQNELMTFKLTK